MACFLVRLPFFWSPLLITDVYSAEFHIYKLNPLKLNVEASKINIYSKTIKYKRRVMNSLKPNQSNGQSINAKLILHSSKIN